VKDLNREIDELYQYANLIEDEKNSNQLKSLTILGTILLIPSLLAGILGMNIWPACFQESALFFWTGLLIPIVVLFGLFWHFYSKDNNFNELVDKIIKGKLS